MVVTNRPERVSKTGLAKNGQLDQPRHHLRTLGKPRDGADHLVANLGRVRIIRRVPGRLAPSTVQVVEGFRPCGCSCPTKTSASGPPVLTGGWTPRCLLAPMRTRSSPRGRSGSGP